MTRTRVVRWPLTLALLVLLMTGCTALGAVLSGSAWWLVLLIVAGVVLVGAAGLRHAGVHSALVPLLSTGGLVVLLTLFFGGGTGLLWLIPTGDTFERFTDLATAGVRSIQTQGTPAQVLDGIMFLLAVGVGLLSILMDLLAIGLARPALAGIPALVPVAVPGFVVSAGADWVALVATAAAYLLLLRIDVHLRGMQVNRQAGGRGAGITGVAGAVRGAITIGAFGIVGSLVFSLSAPVISGGSFGSQPNSALFGAGVSQMIELGQDLRRPQAGPALHYRTTATEQPYLALLTLDDIKGTSWLPRPVEVDEDRTVDSIANPPGLAQRVARTEVTTVVTIDGVNVERLPVPVPAKRVDNLTGDWFWSEGTRAITSTDSTTTGQRYVVTSLELQPTREQLRESGGRYPVAVEPSLFLPMGTPAVVGETARTVSQGTESNYDAAVAIQDYLRGNDFTYDTEAPVDDDYDGGGADVIATFLDVKRGYCVHFASAMALMSRSLGIPARIVLGYLPGTRTTTVIDGQNRYDVDSHDLHAWPELYFVGVGWVPFEPTPGRGTVPEYASPESTIVNGVPSTGGAPSVVPRQNENPGLEGGTADTLAAAEDELPGTLARVGLVAAAVLLLLLAPGVWRLLRRQRRRRLLAAGRAGAVLGWRELTDTAVDHGVEVYDTLTARELADSIRDRPGVGDTPRAREALERMLVATEQARYARPDGPAQTRGAGFLDDLDVVVQALRQGSGAAQRARALIFPASLTSTALRRMGLAAGTPE
ncbi:transglutaminase domain-containing protein [Cryobacterium adonitolivorans]|uniref:Transglutaminase domain-containing protein n=1 Tax=Cryobacterium adonitolivorans TaxID=1259189 RepID=A0A4R8VZ65_9MICO|nr:DUF3488 and transglutaminase-like domain-containing protein [Cryobacterium adonitolivorans]TFB96230.1 transglutaminase domain-containing protein [Cryobacterium adonitolivorans]